ncbi:MAG: TolC family protein, partial [Rhizobacter sp.]
MTRHLLTAAGVATLLAALAGCGTPPPAPTPPAVPDQFRFQAGWVTAPADAGPRGDAWWSLFDDAELDRLMREAGEANGTVEQALARVRQAEARWRLAGAADKPVLRATAGAERARADGATATVWQGSLLASWQPDLWGRVALERQAGRADLKASEADVAAARLAARLELAQAYLRLRVLDRQRELSQQTLAAYERSLTLTRNQYEAGLVARSDVTQAEVQAQSVRAGLHDLTLQRALYEHTIAVLAGRPPASAALAAVATVPGVPVIPAAVPSTLLVHRPDVAAARERLEAASARAGSARRAWLPDITISAAAGVRSGRWSDLFE